MQIPGILAILTIGAREEWLFQDYKGQDNAFVVHKPDGSTKVFKESDRGLYYHDTAGSGTVLVNTVANNKTRYTERDYSRAVLARQIQKIIGRPSTRAFIKIVDNKLLPNCPITRDDIIAAEDIFGPDLGSLKGKTVRAGSERVQVRITDLPITIMGRYREVTLTADIMFVNKLPFFMSISRSMMMTNRQWLPSQE